jgi:hypothetical protein
MLIMLTGHAGLDTLVQTCDKHKKQIGPVAHRMMHKALDATEPLQSILADAIGIVVVASLTWTLLLLKKRWFNSFLNKLSVDGASSDEVR